MISQIRKGKRLSVLFHVVLWVLALLLPLYFFNTEWMANTAFLNHYYLSALTYGFIFYVNYLVLVPKFYFNKKYIYYVAGAILLVALFHYFNIMIIKTFFVISDIQREFDMMIKDFNNEHNISEPPFRLFQAYGYFFTSILILGFSWGLRVYEKYTEQEMVKSALIKENLMTELAFLKNQISPHFFFNTLNNIYSLVEINVDNAQEAILRLSKLMRYLLYESDQEKVKVSEDLEFMKNYIALMNLRLSKKVNLTVNFPEITYDFLIPPLLFIPFIENAYKHGISYRDDCFINIKLQVSDNDLVFTSSNTINLNRDEEKQIFSGIGLENVKKRLELLFPDKFELDIQQTDLVYDVKLKISQLT